MTCMYMIIIMWSLSCVSFVSSGARMINESLILIFTSNLIITSEAKID